MGIFQANAEYYDQIYSDKDYEKECHFLEEIFRRYAKPSPRTILDIGCGTGEHAILLARKSYDVTGIDVSQEMINIAREKISKSGMRIDTYTSDLRSLKLSRKFDACICMFNVIGYMIGDQDISAAMRNMRAHLERGALLVFDFWYGPAVLATPPSQRTKIIQKGDKKIIRFAEPILDNLRQICEISYRIMVINGERVIHDEKEKHVVRFFFPRELEHYLKENDFQVVKFSQFFDLDSLPSEKTWSAVIVAQAI